MGRLAPVAALRSPIIAALCVAAGFAFAGQEPPRGAVAVGQPLPSVTLTDAGGTAHSLGSRSGKALVLVFWSFKCPVSLEYDTRIGAAFARFRGRGVEFLAVASGANESALEVRRNAENLKLPYPVLMDSDGRFAESLGVTQVPAVFVVDNGGIVRYGGAWDDGLKAGEGKLEPFAERAIEAVLSGKAVQTPASRIFGCMLRRR